MPDILTPDFTKIAFPSDKLTIGHLRKCYPLLFDKSEAMAAAFFNNDEPATGEVAAMIACEREFAGAVYRAAIAGQTPTTLGETNPFEEMVGLGGTAGARLMQDYRRFGLAEDAYEARGLLRQLTKASLAHAQSRSTRGIRKR